MEARTTFENVDQYLASLPAVAVERFRELSQVVSEELPGAEQVISYGIPTFRLDGKNLVHIAGYKRHVGLYGTGAMEALAAEVAPYKTGKGTLQFPMSDPLPIDLIRKIVSARVREHLARTQAGGRPRGLPLRHDVRLPVVVGLRDDRYHALDFIL